MRIGAVLLAAGGSKRFGGVRPKQFLKLNGRPVFSLSLKTFLKTPSVTEIVLVLPKDVILSGAKNLRSFGLRPQDGRLKTVPGGDFRGDSVRRGVQALSRRLDVVLIHDTARPMVTREVIKEVARTAFSKGVALAAWPLPDTLKWASGNGRVRKTVPRKNLWLAQTPQGFRADIARKCLLKPSRTATDDVELAERAGRAVYLVEGAPTNMKVTYPHDLKICEAILHKK